MKDVPATAVCPNCGRALPQDAPRGLCTKCLFAAMLEGGPLDGPPQSTITQSGLPRPFGPYELIEEIARGGMGIVYRARQTQINRLVALKVLAAGQFAAPDFVKRFRAEAEAVANLDHRNIVPIYEVGEFEGQPFFSMKLVEGGSLSQRIANLESPISNRDAAKLIATLARAVHYAHQRGILHRDIKPGNVLLDAQEEPHLTDFGVAKLVAKDSTLTRTMAMLGTPSYMSPEQARGEAKQLTTAVDVYGLGALFYELLTGHPPFAAGTTMETVRQVLEKEPRRPSELGKLGTDQDLETISLKCLEKDPGRRYGSAVELAEDLERWLRQEPILARPTTRTERFGKWIRRNPGIATLVLSLNLVGALGLAGILWMGVRARTHARESHERLLRMHVATGNRLVEENDHFEGLLHLVEALRLEGEVAREENHRYRIEAVLRHSPRLKQLFFHGGDVAALAFNPDGTQLLGGGSDSTARVWNVRTGELLLSLPHTGRVEVGRFSSDGKRILTMDREGIARVWSVATGGAITSQLRVDDPDSKWVNHVRKLLVSACFSPDEQCVLTAWGSKSAHVWDAVNGQHMMALSHQGGVHHAAFSSDGRYFVTSSSDKTARVWDARTGQPAAAPLEHNHFVAWAQFSPDGQHLLTVSDRRNVHLWDWVGGRELTRLMTDGEPLFHASFSPQGKQVLTASWNKTAQIWDAATGLCTLRLGHPTGLIGAAWSSDGLHIATAGYDGVVRVWDARSSDRTAVALPTGAASPIGAVAFSAAGRQVAIGSWNGRVQVWDVAEEDSLAQTVRQLNVIRAEFDSTGRRIITASGRDGHCARVWEPATGVAIGPILQHDNALHSARFSRDGKHALTAAGDGTAHLFDIESGRELLAGLRHPAAVRDAAFGLNERLIVTACDDGLARVWDAATGELTCELRHRNVVTSLAISPDGTVVATGSRDGTARLWNLPSGKPVSAPLTNLYEIRGVMFSPDGKLLVAAGDSPGRGGGAAQVWDVRSGKPVGGPMVHDDDVATAEFSSDSRAVVTASYDRSAQVWNAQTGKPVIPALWHRDSVIHAVFSPDTHRVATITAEGDVRLWDATTGEPITPTIPHPSRNNAGHLMFSADGQQLLIATGSDAVFIRKFTKNTAPVDELVRLSQVLSAHRIEPRMGMVMLDNAALSNAWHSVRTAPLTPGERR